MERNLFIALCLMASSLGACATQNDYAMRPSAIETSALRANMPHEQTPFAGELPARNQPMAIAGPTMPPTGYLDYCLRSPSECPSTARRADYREPLNAQRWNELTSVNAHVNNSVRYVTDAALYQMAEFWTYPQGVGDCEDYVLAKRKLLLDKGWPAESLLIGVALDLDNLRHAVLIATTDHGDFVLDNQLTSVVAWADTGYTWEKRQTSANANIWVALTGDAMPLAPFEAPAVQPVLVASAEPQAPTAAAAATTRTPTVGAVSGLLHPRLPMARPRPSEQQIVARGTQTDPTSPPAVTHPTAAGA